MKRCINSEVVNDKCSQGKIMNIKEVGLLSSIGLFSFAAQAQDELKGKWQPGFSGSATFIVGAVESNSQENSGNETINSLDEKAEKTTETFVFPIAASNLNYTFSSGNQRVFIGTSNSDIALGRPHVEVGYRQHVENIGTFGFMYIPGVVPTTTWEDPFLVGKKDKKPTVELMVFVFNIMTFLIHIFPLKYLPDKKS